MSRFPLFEWSSAGGDALHPDFGVPTDGDPGVASQGTLELQSSISLFEERLSLVGGAFGYWESVSTEFDFINFPESPITIPNDGLSKSIIFTDNFSWALFVHGVADITDWLSITGGVRYTKEKKGAARRVENLVLCSDNSRGPCTPDNPNRVQTFFGERSRTFDRITPMASVALTAPDEWLLDGPVDHLLTYFTYSEGFKGGGINAAVRGFLDDDEIESFGQFEQETLRSYELGLKTIAFDRRVRASLAGYYGEYSDLQSPTVLAVPCPPEMPDCLSQPRFIVDNAAEARIAGGELEMTLHPVPAMTLIGTTSYQFTEYTDFPDAVNVLKNPNNPAENPPTIDRSGERLPFVPKFSAHLGVQYAFEIEAPEDWACLDGVLTPRLDWSYRSSVQYWGSELNGNVQRGYNLLNGRLGYLFWDDSIELALWSRNLTDETYFDEVYQIPALVVGSTTRFYATPRTYGGEINYRF